MIIDSGLEFEGIDYDSVARYLGEHLSKEEIVKENLEEIVYIKKENVNKKKKQNRSKKTLNTKACGGDLVDETLANGDELKSAHKTVNRSNKMENKRRKTLDTKKGGGTKANVTTVSDDDGSQAHKTVNNVETQEESNYMDKALNTKACGSNPFNDTMETGDEQKTTHKTVNTSKQVENKGRKTLDTKKSGGKKVNTVSDHDENQSNIAVNEREGTEDSKEKTLKNPEGITHVTLVDDVEISQSRLI